MSLVSNKTKKVFLSKNSKINETQKIDIILSPEFYWLRVFEIPVKTSTQARHVLPTLFEDILEDIFSLSYQVIKLEENRFLCFAYENKTIYNAIKESGIALSLVNAVYFAQNECKNFTSFSFENKNYIYSQDEILVKAPSSINFSETIKLEDNIDNIELSSNKVDIKLYNSVLNTKYLYSLIAIALVASIFNFVKYFSYKNESLLLKEKLVNIKEESSLPNSSIQTNAILNSSKKVLKSELKKREVLSYVLENKSFTLSNISMNKSEIKLSFSNVNKDAVETYLKKKYKLASSSMNGLILNVRIKLWVD